MRIFGILLLLVALIAPAPGALAQSTDNGRAATGGAQTLEDILARQRGEKVAPRTRDDAAGLVVDMAGQLGVRGRTSQAEIWEAMRYGRTNVSVSAGGPEAAILVQDTGMAWYVFRAGPMRTWGGYLLLGMLGLLVLFYLVRGRIRIDGEKTGEKILRFNLLERCAHWIMAVSFIVLGITGLTTLFGRITRDLIFGDGTQEAKEAFATVALGTKWVHNWVAWPFMAALAIVFVLWVLHNLPNRHDVIWLLKGGGMFSRGVHPPAKKFNAGQKIIFWAVIILGASVSVSGLSLLMPFEIPLFAWSFDILNSVGVAALNGGEPLPTDLTPHAEMQLATLWHAIVAFLMMAIILAHIYLGSIGMEGAFDAMGSGKVEMQWAKEHHGLWVEDVTAAEARKAAGAPAE